MTKTLRRALTAGAVTAGVMAAATLAIGLADSGDGRNLLEATLPVAQSLFTTGMIVSATTIALMLTMLGMTSDEHIDSDFYDQIELAAMIAVGVFSVSTVVVIGLAIPFREAVSAGTLYTVLFYVIMGIGALVGGALVSVMVTLLGAIRSLIGLVDEGRDSEVASGEGKD